MHNGGKWWGIGLVGAGTVPLTVGVIMLVVGATSNLAALAWSLVAIGASLLLVLGVTAIVDHYQEW